VGGQGYGDGPVSLTGFDAGHPLFAGLAGASPIADDGYWSALDSYVGPYLARLAVGGDTRGVAAAYDFRSADGLHLLLSAGAASDYIGPGYGWTADGERLFLNAVEWARTVEQTVPAAPALATSSDTLTRAASAALSGTAEFRSTVTVPGAGQASPARDGSFALEAPLVEGPNTFTATARNFAGESPPSAPVTITRDTTAPALAWAPADRTGFFHRELVVNGTATDAHAGVAQVSVNGAQASVTPEGRFAADVDLAEGVNTLTVDASDGLGNAVTETRRVRYFRYTTSWKVKDKDEVTADLFVRDTRDRPVQVDSAVFQLLDADGDVVASEPARRIGAFYRAELGPAPAGGYSVRALLVEAGYAVTESGPAFARVRSASG
jgi:Glucodextranase, domain B